MIKIEEIRDREAARVLLFDIRNNISLLREKIVKLDPENVEVLKKEINDADRVFYILLKQIEGEQDKEDDEIL